ncbi:MAG: dihydrofolate reductase family protein [Microlunatus sp.]|nr:dihydrofolate reductase family protein [Microlunatus sp.]
MGLVRVQGFAISLDGFGTGEGQTMEAPFGHAGERLHEWMFATRTMTPDGGAGIDDEFVRTSSSGVGVEIMGRGKFGPQHGPWENEDWNGWWGDDPPFHIPVIVLTHYPRPKVDMKGGTSFHFMDAKPAEALAKARELARGLDIRIGGGVATIREFLAADLVDHLHLVQVPIVLGRGERLWDGLEGLERRFTIESVSSPSGVTHLSLWRRPGT